jgi:hypothetical protein
LTWLGRGTSGDEEATISIFCVECRKYAVSLCIYKAHPGAFRFEIFFFVLNNTKRVDPKIPDTDLSRNFEGVLKRLI